MPNADPKSSCVSKMSIGLESAWQHAKHRRTSWEGVCPELPRIATLDTESTSAMCGPALPAVSWLVWPLRILLLRKFHKKRVWGSSQVSLGSWRLHTPSKLHEPREASVLSSWLQFPRQAFHRNTSLSAFCNDCLVKQLTEEPPTLTMEVMGLESIGITDPLISWADRRTTVSATFSLKVGPGPNQ